MTETTPDRPAAALSLRTGALTATLLPRAAYDVAYTPDAVVAGFAFDMQAGTHAFGGDRQTPFLTLPYSLALTPAGCDVRSRSDAGGDYLTVRVEPGHERAYAGHYDEGRLRQYSNGMHGAAGIWARRLRRFLLLERHNATAIEELAALLFDGAVSGPEQRETARLASSITRGRLRLLHDLIEARFADGLSVADMAAALGLSTAFFIRAFKAATGSTPHGYLTDRRLAEARRRLRDRGESIAAIAQQSGFSSQAHLTSLFGREFGVTPARYRALVQ